MSHLQIQRERHQYFISDPQHARDLPHWLFDPDAIAERGCLEGSATGRGAASFIRYQDQSLVLRHYWRGGMPARFTPDRFLWQGVKRSRVWREMQLLDTLQRLGLPAPAPVAGRIQRQGLLYRADLITQCIEHTESLAGRLQANPSTTPWRAVGEVIAAFHAAGVGHADLNVRNILIDAKDKVWLIDWDQGFIGAEETHQTRSLERLKRSIKKEPALAEHFDSGWPQLMAGYTAAF